MPHLSGRKEEFFPRLPAPPAWRREAGKRCRFWGSRPFKRRMRAGLARSAGVAWCFSQPSTHISDSTRIDFHIDNSKTTAYAFATALTGKVVDSLLDL